MHKNNLQFDLSESEREAFALLRAKSLSKEEKNEIWQTLRYSMNQSRGTSSLKQGHRGMGIFSLFTQRSFALSTLSIVLILGSGLSVARAAERSLPGQTLYPVKINVNEAVIGSLKRSDTARAEWEQERAGRRIKEAETLAEEGKLGEKERNEIEQHLSQNRKTFEAIEGHDVTDDEFLPQQIVGETRKINVRIERKENETFIHIDERRETEDDERKEKENNWIDEDDRKNEETSLGGYTDEGMKIKVIKNEKKKETRSVPKARSEKASSLAEKIRQESDQKTSFSEKNDSQDEQDSEESSIEQENENDEEQDSEENNVEPN